MNKDKPIKNDIHCPKCCKTWQLYWTVNTIAIIIPCDCGEIIRIELNGKSFQEI